MIVDAFFTWSESAPLERRVEAADALARSYLYSSLGEDERRKVVTGLFTLLDDPSVSVRERLAIVFAHRKDAPRAIVVRLVDDHPRVAAPLLEASQLIDRSVLLESLSRQEPLLDRAVSSRSDLDASLVDFIVTEASSEANLALVANPYARFSVSNYQMFMRRFCTDIVLMGALEAHRRLPPAVHVELVTARARALCSNPFVRACVADKRLGRLADGAQQRAVLGLVDSFEGSELRDAVDTLIRQESLSSAFVLRVCLGGHIALLEQIMAVLCDVPLERVRSAFVHAKPVVTASLLKRSGLSEDVRTVVSMTLVLARELAKSGVDWSADFFAETVIEVVDRQASQTVRGDQNELGGETIALCHSIASDIFQQAARAQANALVATHTSDVSLMIEEHTRTDAVRQPPQIDDSILGSALAA